MSEITRAAGTDPAIDEALVNLARTTAVLDVRRAVRRYLLLAEQEREPVERHATSGVRMVANGDVTTWLHAVLSDLEAAELATGVSQSEESTRADRSPAALADWEDRPWHHRHHTPIHEGWTITGDVDHTLVFRRPSSL